MLLIVDNSLSPSNSKEQAIMPSLSSSISFSFSTWCQDGSFRKPFLGLSILDEEPSLYFCCCCLFFRAAPTAYGSSRLGVQSELQLPSYTTATATQDLSQVCNLHHSSQQHHILNPLSEARGPTRNLVDPSPVHFHWATIGTPLYFVNSLSLSALYSLLPCTINISLPLSFIRLKILFPGAIV